MYTTEEYIENFTHPVFYFFKYSAKTNNITPFVRHFVKNIEPNKSYTHFLLYIIHLVYYKVGCDHVNGGFEKFLRL
jgi:hypothetical protein